MQPDLPFYSLRKPILSDVPAILELVKASWARTYDPVIGVAARRAKSDAKHVPALFLGEIENQGAASMIAEINGRIVGHVGGYMRPTSDHARTFFVDHLHVEPAQHSKGVATGLMNTLRDNVISMADRIELTVLENNHRAIRFYEKQGFVRAKGENEDDGLGGVPSVLMRWELK